MSHVADLTVFDLPGPVPTPQLSAGSSVNPTGLFDTLSLELEDAWGGGVAC